MLVVKYSDPLDRKQVLVAWFVTIFFSLKYILICNSWHGQDQAVHDLLEVASLWGYSSLIYYYTLYYE